jgi:membrane-bound lytic murein transglycosylase B
MEPAMHKPMFDLPAACARRVRVCAFATCGGGCPAGGLGLAGLAPAAHADLWAYVDEFGVTHFAAEALDERYKLFFKGELYDSSQPGLQLKPDSAAEGLNARTRMQSFFEVSPRYKSVRPHLQKAAERTGVDYDLIKAVIAVESGFDAQAVSPKGAVGLMQLMPATAERFGVSASKAQHAAATGRPGRERACRRALSELSDGLVPGPARSGAGRL